jgi:hypothetical protein
VPTAKRAALTIALVVLYAGVALPLSAITTLALWRVIEERYGIESIGHSGPSDWCFVLLYALWLSAGAGIFALRVRRRGSAS